MAQKAKTELERLQEIESVAAKLRRACERTQRSCVQCGRVNAPSEHMFHAMAEAVLRALKPAAKKRKGRG